ncbi:MAG TPA: hypothetical protein VHK66_01930 [Microvirga sp.]|nr:hypothetical protein [Microvirga sp.]
MDSTFGSDALEASPCRADPRRATHHKTGPDDALADDGAANCAATRDRAHDSTLDDPAAGAGAEIVPIDTTLYANITVPIDAPLVTVGTTVAGADPDIEPLRGRCISGERDETGNRKHPQHVTHHETSLLSA